MPRRRTILSDKYPYHVFARSNNREWFSIPISVVYDIFAKVLGYTIERYYIEPHAFVLMSNHFHMLLSTPLANLSRAMRFFMTETSRAIARSSKRINRIYGARYRWTLISENSHFAHALMYLYRNPVKAKIVQKVEDYPWSTISFHHQNMNRLMKPPKFEFEEHIPNNREELLHWLNMDVDENYLNSVQKALRKYTFAFKQEHISGKKPTFFDKLHPKK